MAKQILQLGMGDAIDDWLIGRIQWLRKEEVVASAIVWVKEVSSRLSTFSHILRRAVSCVTSSYEIVNTIYG